MVFDACNTVLSIVKILPCDPQRHSTRHWEPFDYVRCHLHTLMSDLHLTLKRECSLFGCQCPSAVCHAIC